MQVKAQIEKIIKISSDDKTQSQAIRLSLLFTLIIWLILFVILAVSPGWNQKKKYKTVKITLAPVEKTEEKIKPEQKIVEKPKVSEELKQAESAKKSETVKQTQTEKKSLDAKAKTSENQKTSSNSAPKKVENSQNTQKKSATTENSAKPAASEPKKANIKYAKSVDELLEETDLLYKGMCELVVKNKTEEILDEIKQLGIAFDDLSVSEKARMLQFEPDNNSYNIQLYSAVCKACGVDTSDEDKIFEDYQAIYEKTLEMKQEQVMGRNDGGRERAR